jgi:tetratricopeptide (TPR) repeat protein
MITSREVAGFFDFRRGAFVGSVFAIDSHLIWKPRAMRQLIGALTLAALLCCLLASSARAQNEGQQLLDQATEKKIAAESLADLNEVVRLCDQALKKGLDETNTQYANSLLTGTLLQRAGVLTTAIFEKSPPDPRWPELRGVAIQDLERTIKVDPKLGEAHYLIARLHALPGGDLDRARKAIEQAIEHTKGDSEKLAHAKALTLRANLTPFDPTPDTDEAKRAAEKASKQRLADYTAAMEIAPGDNEAVRSRGMFYLVQGKFEEALADFDAALKIEPDEATTHLYRGQALLGQKKVDEAKESFSKAAELNPDSSLPYTYRGRAKAEQKDYAGAIEDFDRALELDRDSLEARFLRARAHQQKGDADAAREDLDVLLKSRPGLAPALELRAVLAANNRDFGQAIADFEQLLKLSPDNAQLLAQLGLLYQASKKPKAAIEKFTAAIEKFGSDNDDARGRFLALRSRADAYLSVGKQVEAVADYEQAIKMEPKDSNVLNNLAWVLATSPDDKLRDGKRAIELATKGCEATDYKAPHILSTLAAAFAETGKWEEAVKWSKKALELGDEESIKDQLAKELASYEAKKPWRERQEMPDEEQPTADDKDKTESVLKKDDETK